MASFSVFQVIVVNLDLFMLLLGLAPEAQLGFGLQSPWRRYWGEPAVSSGQSQAHFLAAQKPFFSARLQLFLFNFLLGENSKNPVQRWQNHIPESALQKGRKREHPPSQIPLLVSLLDRPRESGDPKISPWLD